jgi:hypothetical protein
MTSIQKAFTSVRETFIRLFPARAQPMLRTALAADLYLGCTLGAGAGYWAIAASAVEHIESGDLLALAGAGVGLLAATLATIALLLAFMTGPTLDVIRGTGGLDPFVRPFRLIAIVDALAILASVAGSIDSSSITKSGAVSPGPTDLASVLFGVAIWLFVWAVVGVAQLVRIFIDYGNVHLKATEDEEDDDDSPDAADA